MVYESELDTRYQQLLIEEQGLNQKIIDENENTINFLYSYNQATEYYDDPNLIDTYVNAFQEAYGPHFEQTYNEVYEQTLNEMERNESDQKRYENLLKEHLNTFMT